MLLVVIHPSSPLLGNYCGWLLPETSTPRIVGFLMRVVPRVILLLGAAFDRYVVLKEGTVRERAPLSLRWSKGESHA